VSGYVKVRFFILKSWKKNFGSGEKLMENFEAARHKIKNIKFPSAKYIK